MRRWKVGLAVAMVASAVVVPGARAYAPTPYQDSIGQIAFGANSVNLPGGTTDPGPSDIYGYTFSMRAGAQSQLTKVGGGGQGRPSFDNMSITKRLDRMSPQMMQVAARGQRFPLVRIDIFATGSNSNYSYCLHGANVTSDNQGYNSTYGDNALETFTLQYDSITQVFAPQSPFAVMTGGWDVVLGRIPPPDVQCPPLIPNDDG